MCHSLSSLVSQTSVRNVESADNVASAGAMEDGESDVEANDGDATAAKELARHTDTQEYEGEEEERQEVGDAMQLEDMDGKGWVWVWGWVGVGMCVCVCV